MLQVLLGHHTLQLQRLDLKWLLPGSFEEWIWLAPLNVEELSHQRSISAAKVVNYDLVSSKDSLAIVPMLVTKALILQLLFYFEAVLLLSCRIKCLHLYHKFFIPFVPLLNNLFFHHLFIGAAFKIS